MSLFSINISKIQGKFSNNVTELIRASKRCADFYEEKVELLQKNIDDKKFVHLVKMSRIMKKQRHILGSERKETKHAISEIEEMIEFEKKLRYKKVAIEYGEYKKLIALKTLIKELIGLINHEIDLVERILDKPYDNDNYVELQKLLANEGQIYGKESSLLTEVSAELQEIEKPVFTKVVIGYGSLMNPKSLFKTLKQYSPEAKRSFERDPEGTIRQRVVPVVVYGYKRIFNIIVSESSFYRTEENIKKKMLAALGLQIDPKSYFNAVAIRVSDEEFKGIRKREEPHGYKLNQVKCRNLLTGKPIENAYTSVPGVPGIKKGVFDPDFFKKRPIRYDHLCPLRYYLLCSLGARKMDHYLGLHIMEKMFKSTTYLLDVELDPKVLERLRQDPKNKHLRRRVFKNRGFMTMKDFEKRGGKVHYGGEPILRELVETKEFKHLIKNVDANLNIVDN